ncbi:MAG: hypothetical protein JWM11_4846 [Planctomycetaceae bacterium]|nr:hypothetical protein [Planctomycetaceae bacterium]
MRPFLRTVLSTVAGLITALLLLIAVEGFSAVVHPVPEGFGSTPEEMCQHVANYPPWVLAVVVPMWGGIAFLSVWLTAKIGNLISAGIVGTLFMAAVIANIMMLPYPSWFSIACPLVTSIAVVMAVRLNYRRSPTGQAVGNTGSDVRSEFE